MGAGCVWIKNLDGGVEAVGTMSTIRLEPKSSRIS